MQLAMITAGFFCLLVGSYLPFLYNMLPNSDVTFHPYGSYHLSETLQLLAFTAIAFFFLKDKIGARASISLDLDWFYRKGGQLFLWFAKSPVQWLDTCWGAAYRVVGLYSLMTKGGLLPQRCEPEDNGVVDGSARCVRAIGRRITITMQRGQIQQTIYISATFAAILLASYVWL